MTELVFSEFDESKHKEQLFMFKLKLFEVPDIKNSKNRELKAKLRKSKDFIDALKYMTLIVRPED